MRDVMCVAHVTGVRRKTVRIRISEPVPRPDEFGRAPLGGSASVMEKMAILGSGSLTYLSPL